MHELCPCCRQVHNTLFCIRSVCPWQCVTCCIDLESSECLDSLTRGSAQFRFPCASPTSVRIGGRNWYAAGVSLVVVLRVKRGSLATRPRVQSMRQLIPGDTRYQKKHEEKRINHNLKPVSYDRRWDFPKLPGHASTLGKESCYVETLSLLIGRIVESLMSTW